jgi:hypothetical protein
MTRIRTFLAAGSLITASTALALDTSDPFLCAVTQVNECLDGFECSKVLPEEVNAPTFMWIDMKKKQIRTDRNSEGLKIANMTTIDGRHILQGAQDGNPEAVDGTGWSLSIEDATGRFVAAIAVQQASVTMFGACTELE